MLLSGEYSILDGAWGIALPTKPGQTLHIKSGLEKGLLWNSYYSDGSLWFSHLFRDLEHDILNESPVISKLASILLEASQQNPEFASKLEDESLNAETRLEFDAAWGLGSSSTLIYCIAQWAQIDAFQLLFNTIGGSGYDIACAGSQSPLMYSLKNGEPFVKDVSFSPSFKEKIHFVYLNKKQSTDSSLRYYDTLNFDRETLAKSITAITNDLVVTQDQKDFNRLLDEHENLMSAALKIPKVKTLYFHDFPGAVKSLGAWGGDFVLASSEELPKKIEEYFKAKGYTTILSYNELICQP